MMASGVGNEESNIVMLERLMALDFDALAAYQAAIPRVSGPDLQRQLYEFSADHLRHVTDLEEVIKHLGGEPPAAGELRRLLRYGRDAVVQLRGDADIRLAMQRNAEETEAAYRRAARRRDVPEYVQAMLASFEADEARHRGWLAAAQHNPP